MEKSSKDSKQYFYCYTYINFLVIFVVCFEIGLSTLCGQYSKLVHNNATGIPDHLRNFNSRTSINSSLVIMKKGKDTSIHSCSGRYIYMYSLPSRFNEDIIKNCSSLYKWFDIHTKMIKWTDMCKSVTNFGLGPLVSKSEGLIQNRSWYATNQFTLELIFHQRMKGYECLTGDPTLATAIFVPFYTGLELSRNLWNFNNSVKDASALALTRWLAARREWKRLNGKDHFFIVGRVAWDIGRETDREIGWGSNSARLPEVKNMTMLTIESTCKEDNEFAIPYPTYFHPGNKHEVLEWQRDVIEANRHYLYAFMGARRQHMETSIRNEIIDQCLNSSNKCLFVDCSTNGTINCNEPVEVMRVFKNSTFCLQPQGDTATRRSTFDSILAGCIPVFFHADTAYNQYKWHFPQNQTAYSVFIPEESVRNREANIEKILLGFSESQLVEMRREVNRMIPKVVYSDPESRVDGFEDAFDVSVKSVLARVEKIRINANLSSS